MVIDGVYHTDCDCGTCISERVSQSLIGIEHAQSRLQLATRIGAHVLSRNITFEQLKEILDAAEGMHWSWSEP